MRIYGRLNRYVPTYIVVLRTIHGRLGLIWKIKKALTEVRVNFNNLEFDQRKSN